MDSVTRLVLIRHGESRATVDQMMGGHEGCRGLTERGKRQAEALADRLTRTGELADASVLLASVLPRAVETAEIVAPILGGLEVKQVCDFCELHVGAADGLLSWEEFRERYRPEEHSRDHFRPLAPGAESMATFLTRVQAALAGVATEHAGATVVIVCHGGVIEGSLMALGNLPVRRGVDVTIGNTSLTEWTRPVVETGEQRWTLTRFNDTAHLADVD
ncbi:MAG: histidine phosphatase family protein [Pseudonocardiaceae bacterium]